MAIRGSVRTLVLSLLIAVFPLKPAFCQNVKGPDVAGQFYPADPKELKDKIQYFFDSVDPRFDKGEIFGLILPHAGYDFSGKTASYGYKLIKDKPYKTIVIIASSHRHSFRGVAVYAEGAFRTPLGEVEVDADFAKKMLAGDEEVREDESLFGGEHPIEVQIPFLQVSLSGFKIVPVIMGSGSFLTCRKLAGLLKSAIGERRDVLVIASTDLYHGYDYEEADTFDRSTLGYIRNMDEEGLYYAVNSSSVPICCGGMPVVTMFILAKDMGHDYIKVLDHTNSALVTGNMFKGVWTVGYAACAIDQPKGEDKMLDKAQKKRLLGIARKSIEDYLSGKDPAASESDPVLNGNMGAFVTLHKKGELRGCIGRMIADGPLYLTVKDMAVEAAVRDPRFPPVSPGELKDIEIEISVLTPLEKVDSADEIQLGKHGVLVRKGFRSGVFLPQVAVETGWTKEEFLSNLCAGKAGLSPNAWKDGSAELYIFSAVVFSEKELSQ